ncbi:MAG: hypothetical protein HYT80_00725 [Euryarchaeota archaeon]|nr:hypothetical protein [Euryarchaeota archaeon]
MTGFRIAGSFADEETLAQVVRIAGYSANLHRLVSDHFASCPVHAKAPARIRKSPRQSCVRGCPPPTSDRFLY